MHDRPREYRSLAPKLNIPRLLKNWEAVFSRLPVYPEGTVGNLSLRYNNYERGEIARFYDPRIGRLMYDRYTKRISFPNLVETPTDGGRPFTWMSAEQSEVSGMAAHARIAYGNVLIAGLGLGVMPWLAAKNVNVKAVTIVEIRPEVVELIAPAIENKKIMVICGDVWEHIAASPGGYDFIDLDIWPDVGTAVMAMEETHLACAGALNPGGIVRTWMDEMALRLINDRVLDGICLAMNEDQGGRFAHPTIQSRYPCEFCGTRDYIDCYHLCMECCRGLTLPYQIGGIIQERFIGLMKQIYR